MKNFWLTTAMSCFCFDFFFLLDPSQTMVSSITASQNPSQTMVSSITASKKFKCTCSDDEITLMVIIAVLGVIIIFLVAVIIWQQRKLSK